MTEHLSPADITADPGLQPRAGGIDEDTVKEYAAAKRAGAKFPPLVVYREAPGTNWLSEGFHRLAADLDCGAETIECEVRPGTRRDALLNAAASNTSHGLKRTNADKRRAVELVLRECPDWSDRRVAAAAGVSDPFVGSVRAQLLTVSSCPPAGPQVLTVSTCPPAEPQVITVITCQPEPETFSLAEPEPAPASPPPAPATVKGKDGKTYPAKGKGGKKPAAKPAEPAPSAPPASPPPPAPAPAAQPRDQLGRVLPKKLIPVFAARDRCRTASATIGQAAKLVKALDADGAVGGFLRKRPHLNADLAGVADYLRTRTAPYAVCAACDGDGDRGDCPSCGGKGWNTRYEFQGLADAIQQKARSFKPGDAWEGDDPVPDGCECEGADAGRDRTCVSPTADPAGRAIPKHLRDLFHGDFLYDALRDLKRLAAQLKDAQAWLAWLEPETHKYAALFIEFVEKAVPHEVCAACGGAGKGCGACRTSGYHPKWSCAMGQNKPAEKPKPGKGGRKGAA